MSLEPCPKHNRLPIDLFETGEYTCEVCYEEGLNLRSGEDLFDTRPDEPIEPTKYDTEG